MTATEPTAQPGTVCEDPAHTHCPHPEGATLWLGGNAWAHPTVAEHLQPLDTVTTYPGNPRRGDQDAITTSVSDLGIYKAQITYQLSTSHVLTGNHTLRGLLDLGAVLAPATAVDVANPRAAAIVARDNRTSDLGDYDDAALLALLQSDPAVLASSGYGDSPESLLLMQRRAEAEHVFTVGTDHMVDEFQKISGQDALGYTLAYARKVSVFLRDAAAIEDFRKRLGITEPLGADLNYPLGWTPDDRRKYHQAAQEETPAEGEVLENE